MQQEFLIEKGKDLDTETLRKIINKFQTLVLPSYIKYQDYYDGKQLIIYKMDPEKVKTYNRVCTNYCYNIVHNYLGYITGKPIKYENDNLEDLLKILKFNDVSSVDNEYLKQALIYGKAFEACYVDLDGKQRFKILDSRNCIPVYSDDLDQELLYVIRLWKDELATDSYTELLEYTVEVYGPKSIKRYKSAEGFLSFNFIEEIQHHYNQCPISVFNLTSDKDSIFALIMTMQDAYNELVSGEIDSYQDFSDAYLLMTNCSLTNDQLESFRKNRFMSIDSDCKAEFITKNVSDTQVLDIQLKLNDNIHKIASSPDFNDDKFMAQSGVAMKFKLVGFENMAATIETNMKKALQRRLELLCSVLSITGFESDNELMWRDVNIIFSRNLPNDLVDITNMVNSLRDLVSDRTLLGLIPFIYDIDREQQLIKEQRESNLYDFSKMTEEVDNEEPVEKAGSQEEI